MRKKSRDSVNQRRTKKATKRSLKSRGVTSDVTPGATSGVTSDVTPGVTSDVTLGVTSDVTPGVTSDVNNETQKETQVETQKETQDPAPTGAEISPDDSEQNGNGNGLGSQSESSKPHPPPEPKPQLDLPPGEVYQTSLRTHFGGATDFLSLAAHCEAKQIAAGGNGDGKSWTIPPEAGGADSLGDAMLVAWLEMKRVYSQNVPDKLKSRWCSTLGKLARTIPDIPATLAVQAVKIVLDPEGQYGWYKGYSDPAVKKFQRDWTDVVLGLLSGNEQTLTVGNGHNGHNGNGRSKPRGFTGIEQLGREEGWW